MLRRLMIITVIGYGLLAAGGVFAHDTVRVGVLHSLTGTMAISEVTVKNATLLAIDEINAKGGVTGKENRAGDGGRRVGTRDLRPKGTKAYSGRQGRHRIRGMDVGQPQGDAAGV